jgi:prepilin-type N-terminal cleavage/methylation domain-containing protein
MLKQLKQRKESGFTIIEVLIVLAIAGLIMVIVFLAVPGLQRSQRNNGLSTDANNILTASNNWSADNGGSVAITTGTVSGGVATISGAAGTNNESAKVDAGLGTITVNTSPALTNAAAVGSLEIVTGPTAACNSTSSGLGGTGTSRSIAVLYVAESGGTTNQLKCVD